MGGRLIRGPGLLALLVLDCALLQATVGPDVTVCALIVITMNNRVPVLGLVLSLFVLLRHDHAFLCRLFDRLDVHGRLYLPASDLIQGYGALILLLLLLVTNGNGDRLTLSKRIGGPTPFAVLVEVGRVSVRLLRLLHFFVPLI